MSFLKNKIPPPIVAILSAVLITVLSNYGPALSISMTIKIVLVALFVLTALVFNFSAIIAFRQAQTTVNPLKPDTASALQVSGVYRYSRNPMYLGMALLLCAWCVYEGGVIACLVVPLFVLYITIFQIMPEEKALESIFKDEFSQYKRRVRRWV